MFHLGRNPNKQLSRRADANEKERDSKLHNSKRRRQDKNQDGNILKIFAKETDFGRKRLMMTEKTQRFQAKLLSK